MLMNAVTKNIKLYVCNAYINITVFCLMHNSFMLFMLQILDMPFAWTMFKLVQLLGTKGVHPT